MHGIEDIDKYQVVEGVDMRTFKPRPHHVVIRWLHKEESKGGILIPQYRQRKLFMKGQVLVSGPECNPRLKWGAVVMFNALGTQENVCEKEFFGVQDPNDRDSVFVCEDIHVLGTLNEDATKCDMLDNWILVLPDEGPEEKSGLLVPDAMRNRERVYKGGWTGLVVSIGDYVDKGTCMVGDHIVYETLGAVSVFLNDKPHVVIYESEQRGGQSVLGILEESAA